MNLFNNQDRSKDYEEYFFKNDDDDIANSFSGKVWYYFAMGLFVFVIAGLLYVIFFM